jgi:hypothetical protein
MENNQQEKVGAAILTLSIIQLVFSGLAIMGYLITFFMKDQIKAAGVPAISTSTLIISMVIALIAALGIFLILMRKQLGIYVYFIAQVSVIVYSLVNNGFKPSVLLSLIIPVLMGIFIWQKKEVFNIGTKAEEM